MQALEVLQNPKIRKLLLTLLFILPFEVLSFFSVHAPEIIEIPLFVAIILLVGRSVLLNGIRSLFRLRFSDMNLLMTVAITGALFLGELEEAVVIVLLFAISESLEDFGIERSQKALDELIAKTPKTAFVKGKKVAVLVDTVKIGDIIVVKSGEYIPLDGVVANGESLIDESAITGEPLPKTKIANDHVFAGSMNGQGYLEISVTKAASQTTLAKIIELTAESADRKSRTARFIETFATYYTPGVFIVALLTVLIPVVVFHMPFLVWFNQGLTLLLIACPCALVISTPVTVFSAIGNASKRGILIKGGQFLEEMGSIKAIAFDKTRTLTKGEPVVSDIVPLHGVTKEELLACVAGIESLSEHPIAKSVVESAKRISGSIHPFSKFKPVFGKGITGECLVCVDKHHCVGTLQFVLREHKVDKLVVDTVERFEKEGKTAIVISDDKKVSGIIGVTDEVRPESHDIINQLGKLNVHPVMLTGDNASAALFTAHLLGITDIQAQLLPEDKVSKITELRKTYGTVGMVGDGINDTPALATASVGIAMGSVGSDLAVEHADIALMNTNLALIPFLVRLGRKSKVTISANIALALGVKGLFLVLAVLGRSNIAMAILADVGVTFIVVMNGLRLFNAE